MRVDLQRLIRHVEVGTELIGSLVLLERGACGVDDLRRSIRRLLAVDDRADVVADDAWGCEVEIRQHDDDRVVIDESLEIRFVSGTTAVDVNRRVTKPRAAKPEASVESEFQCLGFE